MKFDGNVKYERHTIDIPKFLQRMKGQPLNISALILFSNHLSNLIDI